MTTLTEDLQALLAPLAAGSSWYAINTAEPPVYPYIVFLAVISVANVTLQGPSNLQSTRFQIDIISRQVSEAKAIEAAVEQAMNAWSVANVQLTSQDLYEDAVRAFRITKDYSVWATN